MELCEVWDIVIEVKVIWTEYQMFRFVYLAFFSFQCYDGQKDSGEKASLLPEYLSGMRSEPTELLFRILLGKQRQESIQL